jgi:hypothetical protein
MKLDLDQLKREHKDDSSVLLDGRNSTQLVPGTCCWYIKKMEEEVFLYVIYSIGDYKRLFFHHNKEIGKSPLKSSQVGVQIQ